MNKQIKPTAPIKASTQDFVEIEAIKDDILMFKDNSCCVIIAAGTTNFDLLSEDEQHGMIYAYASLLNSLSFPIQICIISKRTSVTSYLALLDEKIKLQTIDVLKNRLESYKDFIKNLIKQNTVLEKNFYFVIPFFALELGAKIKVAKEYVIARAKTALYPKRDHLLRLLKKTGLGGKVLAQQEIVELFFNLYNQDGVATKLASPESYTDIISTASDTISTRSEEDKNQTGSKGPIEEIKSQIDSIDINSSKIGQI